MISESLTLLIWLGTVGWLIFATLADIKTTRLGLSLDISESFWLTNKLIRIFPNNWPLVKLILIIVIIGIHILVVLPSEVPPYPYGLLVLALLTTLAVARNEQIISDTIRNKTK